MIYTDSGNIRDTNIASGSYTPDTNIIKAILKGNKKVKDKVEKILEENKNIVINGICYYETKRGFLKINAHAQLARFENFCKKYGLVFLDTLPIYDKAAQIHAELELKGEHLEDADILIASIAHAKNLVLVTDDDHFDRIHDIKTEKNWIREKDITK